MSFQPSDPTTIADWLPTPASAIGDILRGGAAGGGDPPPPDPGGLRAFPGAAGYGAEAMLDADWDDVRIYQVTSTDASGAGTLRQAIIDAHGAPATAAKFIIFRVGGWHDYESGEKTGEGSGLTGGIIDGENIYIAGQTAPGDGVGLGGTTGNEVRLSLGVNRSDIIPKNIILRYLTIRNPPNSGQYRHSSCMMIHLFEDCIVDHFSFSWSEGRMVSSDNGPAIGTEARKLTLSHNLYFESLAFHATGISLGGERESYEESGVSNMTHISEIMSHHASTDHRSPNYREGQAVEVINALMHNCESQTWYGKASILDHIACYESTGPFSDIEGFVSVLNNTFDSIPSFSQGPSLYVAQNVSELWDLTDINLDNWVNANLGNQGDIDTDRQAGLVRFHTAAESLPIQGDASEVADWRRNKRFYEADAFVGTLWEGKPLPTFLGPPAFPHIILTPSAARDLILGTGLQGAGNIHGINAAGEWFVRVDAVDQRAKDEALGNSAEEVTGGAGRESTTAGMYPTMAAGTAPTDSDADGLPDAYCTKYGLSTSGNFATVLISEDFPSSPIGARPHIWAWLNGVSPVDGSTQMAS